MAFDYILFDLDGTLTDPYVGITESVKYALEFFGKPIPDKEILKQYIGPPLMWSFKELAGIEGEDTEKAVWKYRERYQKIGWKENILLDGAEDLLKNLKAKGKKIGLATSKPELISIEILKLFKIDKYFDFMGGASMDFTRNTKVEVVKYTLENLGVKDLSKAVLVGDRHHDIDGAKEAGIASIGVLVGYGDREEFEKAGADYIAETLADVEKLV